MLNTVDRPVRTAHIVVHHYNSTQYCNIKTVFFSIFRFLQTNIISRTCGVRLLAFSFVQLSVATIHNIVSITTDSYNLTLSEVHHRLQRLTNRRFSRWSGADHTVTCWCRKLCDSSAASSWLPQQNFPALHQLTHGNIHAHYVWLN